MTERSSIETDIRILEEKRAVVDRAHNQSRRKIQTDPLPNTVEPSLIDTHPTYS
jgi:hypothetical protein